MASGVMVDSHGIGYSLSSSDCSSVLASFNYRYWISHSSERAISCTSDPVDVGTFINTTYGIGTYINPSNGIGTPSTASTVTFLDATPAISSPSTIFIVCAAVVLFCLGFHAGLNYLKGSHAVF